MNLRSKLVGNAVIYLGANILNAGIPFLLLPILTRVLTPTDYGTIAMFGVMLIVLSAFTGLSVHGAIGVRYFQLSKEELAEYVGICIGILVISTAVIFLLVVAFGGLLTKISGVPTDWLMMAVALSALQFVCNIRLSLWQVSGAAKKYGIFQISQSLVNAVGSLILILVIGMAWEGRILGQAIAIIVFGVIAIWWLLKDNFFKFPRRWPEQSRDALKFGVPLIPHLVGGVLIVAADRFVIVRLLDVAHAGIYMVALQVGQALGLLTEAFNRAYAPWLMKNLSSPTTALRIKIVRGTYIYFAAIILAAIVFGASAPLFLDFLVGKSFKDAGELVIYIALGFAFGGCYYMVTNYVFFESKTSVLALITFVCGFANILLMFILVQNNGLVGAGQAFMLTNILSFIGTWWLAQKFHPMPWLKALRPAATSQLEVK